MMVWVGKMYNYLGKIFLALSTKTEQMEFFWPSNSQNKLIYVPMHISTALVWKTRRTECHKLEQGKLQVYRELVYLKFNFGKGKLGIPTRQLSGDWVVSYIYIRLILKDYALGILKCLWSLGKYRETSKGNWEQVSRRIKRNKISVC